MADPSNAKFQQSMRRLSARLKGDVRNRFITGATRGLAMLANAIIGEAQQLAPQSPSNQYIPGKRKEFIKNPAWTGHSGALRDSGTVKDPEITALAIVVWMGFYTVYAARQHEELTYRHTNGQAKFLEIPFRKLAPKAPEIIKAQIHQELRK